MSDIERLRGLLRDRQVKEGARGTADAEVCLDTSLIDDLVKLEDERTELAKDAPKDDGRLAGAPKPDTSDLDSKIDAKNEEIAAATVKLCFKSLSSVDYQAMINKYPGVDNNDADELRAKFYDELAQACLYKIELGGVDITKEASLDEIREQFTFGEWEPIRRTVLVLNRRKIDVPFSSKRSAKTR